MFASTKAGGMGFAMPDVCKVPAPPAPPIPTPFPNMAMLNMANGGTCTRAVKIMNQPVVHKSTMIPRTSGDEAGVAGGVISGMNMGPAAFKMASMKVKVEGTAVVTHLKPTGQNGTSANAFGAQVTPSQTAVLVMG
jgi:hypothetical protein